MAEAKVRKKHKVRLDIDLKADLTGFGTASRATAAHHRLAKHYASPLFFGPPRSDDLLELMMHMYTEDEADVAQHLLPLWPRTAASLSKRTSRTVQDVTATLDVLSQRKRVVVAMRREPPRYTIFPLLPGTMEMTLMRPELAGYNSWHRRFAELFHRIWGSGYIKDYVPITPAPIRYLPAAAVGDSLYMAWPSDRLEQILDRYDKFAIGQSQCRVATRLVGEGCNKPTENCVAFGPVAELVLVRGAMRSASRTEVLEAKKNAEQHGCMTFMANEFGDPRGNASCSCCGCCCHALRTINQFSAPGLICRPHFTPQRHADRCKLCGRCANNCPMGAWQKIGARLYFDSKRCIGCGLCVTACRNDALELQPVPQAPEPEHGYGTWLGRATPTMLTNAFRVWLKRTLLS